RHESARAQAQAQERATELRRAEAQAQEQAAGVLPARPMPRLEMTAPPERRVMGEAPAALPAAPPGWAPRAPAAHPGAARSPGARADEEVLDRLAGQVMAGRAGEYVALLSAPEWPRVPDGLRRANGESVFRPPGAELYAAQAQITLEERLMSNAQGLGAPR